MKKLTKLIALLLAVLTVLLTACQLNPPEDPTESSDNTTEELSEITRPEIVVPPAGHEGPVYNIIFALASIPPVMAALHSIESGYETYAIIERGKTYNGIDSVEKFHNAGFDPANNLSTGFTTKEFEDMVNKVKELKSADENAYFIFYVQDGTALKGAAIAANAGVAKESFHIYMCEDGTGAYHALNDKYASVKKDGATADSVYDAYKKAVDDAQARFDRVMAKTDNKNGDKDLGYNIGLAWALASMDNFTYYLQDEATVIDILEGEGETKTKLLTTFGVEGCNDRVELFAKLEYETLAESVSGLTEAQRTSYLNLMYGQYYADTYSALTRSERAGESAPAKKLVFIGSRHGLYPHFATDEAYGIGGLAEDARVPATYAELDSKYKTPLLFATEADYNVFLDELNDIGNYTAGTADAVKELAKTACFNLYIDYIFNLKLTYALYGAEYDIIMKGHPREAIGAFSEWGNRYKVKVDDNTNYVFDKLLDNALLAFHAGDSTGKYIGMVPYGTSAENLAYLGADIAIAGLPSSTYSGFDTDVDVLFILAETDEDIAGSGKAEAASQVKGRYESGNLLYTDKEGKKQTTVFLNTGNVFKYLAEAYKTQNAEFSSACLARYNAWLASARAGAVDIDAQGFAVNTADN